jgi:hypothetical protein
MATQNTGTKPVTLQQEGRGDSLPKLGFVQAMAKTRRLQGRGRRSTRCMSAASATAPADMQATADYLKG